MSSQTAYIYTAGFIFLGLLFIAFLVYRSKKVTIAPYDAEYTSVYLTLIEIYKLLHTHIKAEKPVIDIHVLLTGELTTLAQSSLRCVVLAPALKKSLRYTIDDILGKIETLEVEVRGVETLKTISTIKTHLVQFKKVIR